MGLETEIKRDKMRIISKSNAIQYPPSYSLNTRKPLASIKLKERLSVYKTAYADMLLRWCCFTSRAELLKRGVSVVISEKTVDVKTVCAGCGKMLGDKVCNVCRRIGASCSICHLPVKRTS
jgi:hypothetical protein